MFCSESCSLFLLQECKYLHGVTFSKNMLECQLLNDGAHYNVARSSKGLSDEK